MRFAIVVVLLTSVASAQEVVKSGSADERLKAAGYVKIYNPTGDAWFWGKPGDKPETPEAARIRFQREDATRGVSLPEEYYEARGVHWPTNDEWHPCAECRQRGCPKNSFAPTAVNPTPNAKRSPPLQAKTKSRDTEIAELRQQLAMILSQIRNLERQ